MRPWIAQPRLSLWSKQVLLGLCSALMLDELLKSVVAILLLLSIVPYAVVQPVLTSGADAAAAAAFFNGVRKGLWSPLEAPSRRRRLLAGVDMTWPAFGCYWMMLTKAILQYIL